MKGCPMDKHAVPDIGSKLKVSPAVPDILYSYNFGGEFHQQLLSIWTTKMIQYRTRTSQPT
jgi:hypothetical protein